MNANTAGPHVVEERCNACGLCVEVCAQEALELHAHGAEMAHPERCDGCCTCEEVCPQGAIACEFTIEWDEQPGATPTAAEKGG